MIYDCFIFLNEYDILELHLKELYNVVDYFVIIEGTVSFTGVPKESNFNKNKDRYTKYIDKIKYFYLPNYVDINNPWYQEYKQRENIIIALSTLSVNDTDIIISGDVDEITSPEILKNNIPFIFLKQSSIFKLEFDYYVYNIESYVGKWDSTVCLLYKTLLYLYNINNNILHHLRTSIKHNLEVIPFAGWHLSFFGGLTQIQIKMNNFAHQEYNKEEFISTSNLERAINNNVCFWNNKNLIHKPIQDNILDLPINIDIILNST